APTYAGGCPSTGRAPGAVRAHRPDPGQVHRSNPGAVDPRPASASRGPDLISSPWRSSQGCLSPGLPAHVPRAQEYPMHPAPPDQPDPRAPSLPDPDSAAWQETPSFEGEPAEQLQADEALGEQLELHLDALYRRTDPVLRTTLADPELDQLRPVVD